MQGCCPASAVPMGRVQKSLTTSQQRLLPDAVRQCIAGIAEVPSEYDALKLYKECLVAARE